jgi:hypothetical protein
VFRVVSAAIGIVRLTQIASEDAARDDRCWRLLKCAHRLLEKRSAESPYQLSLQDQEHANEANRRANVHANGHVDGVPSVALSAEDQDRDHEGTWLGPDLIDRAQIFRSRLRDLGGAGRNQV